MIARAMESGIDASYVLMDSWFTQQPLIEQWLEEQVEIEANMPIFKKAVRGQLDVPLNLLRSGVPLAPEWGVKKNLERKNVFYLAIKGI